MIDKLKTIREESENGFTLIEILVVILIIGILAAIAIPLFLNQRQKANEASLRSDLRNAGIAVETHFSENPTDVTVTATEAVTGGFKPSSNTQYAFRGNANTWCVVGVQLNSKFNSTGTVATALTYDSVGGGIMPDGWNWHTQSKCETADTSWSWLNTP